MLRAICEPNAHLNDIAYRHIDQTSLFVACQADIANHLGEEALNADTLSETTGIEGEKLARYLPNLANSHVFEEVAPFVFRNNQLSVGFKAESKRALVGYCVDEARASSSKSWDELTDPSFKHSIAPPSSAFSIPYDLNLNTIYPWAKEEESTIIDVGGGVSTATLPILQEFSKLNLNVEDVPDSEDKFQENLTLNFAALKDSGRVQFQAFDFFKEQPIKNGDIYFLHHVIHNSADTEAIKILQNIAEAMTTSSKLLICEHVISPTYRGATNKQRIADPDDFHTPKPLLANWGNTPASRLDLQVSACSNGNLRTED